jgi:hypothetical protein
MAVGRSGGERRGGALKQSEVPFRSRVGQGPGDHNRGSARSARRGGAKIGFSDDPEDQNREDAGGGAQASAG